MNTQQSPLWRSADNALYSEMELIAKISSQEHGVYVFDVAASSLLQQLKQERSNIQIFPCAEIITLIVDLCKKDISQSVSNRLAATLSQYQCFAIEDIHLLFGKTSTLKLIEEVIRMLKTDHLIVINGRALTALIPELCIQNAQYFSIYR